MQKLSTYNLALIVLAITTLAVLLSGPCLVSSEMRSFDSSSLWVSITPIPIPDGAAGIALAFSRGHLYAVGGATGYGNDPLDTVYDSVFWGRLSSDGSVQDWEPLDPFTSPIAFASVATTSNGWIYITGGARDISTPTGDTWYALPSETGQIDDWHLASGVTPFTPRFAHASVISGANLYVIGGFVDLTNILTDVSYANIDLGEGGLASGWESTEPLTTARYGHSAVLLNNRIYVIGGVLADTLVPTNTVVFAETAPDGITTPWQPAKSLPSPVAFGPTVAVTSTHKIYVFGGWNGDDTFTKTVYSALVNRENGEIEEWTKEDGRFDLPEELYRHSIVLAPSGSVYLVGGKHPGDNGYRNSVYYVPPLTFSKSNEPTGPLHEGDFITYTISYANTSLITQTVTITDLLPFNVTLLPDTVSHPGMPQDSKLVWDLGDIRPGGSGEVSFQAQVPQIPPIEPASGGVASSSDVDLVEPVPIVCATNRFLAAGVTIQPPPLPNSRTIQVKIPSGTDPSEMWLMMKGTNNVIPTVGGHPAQLVTTSSINGFGASLWSASFTPTMVASNQVVTVTTWNSNELNKLNALFLFDKDYPPFDETTLGALHQNETETFNYTLEIPPGITQTTYVILPMMDISYWRDGQPDTRVTTVTVQVDDRHSSPAITNNPNLGDGLLMPKFSFVTDTSSETITSTVALTVNVVTEDSVYILGPRICWSVWIKNTAWLCSRQAGCISDTVANPPLGVSGIYLPLILRSSP
jgi:uncharacterized repeat protein (TIGR01451 family)